MSRLLCCLRARRHDMGAALSQPHEAEGCDGVAEPVAPPTMADVIRERKKKAGGAALGTLRRRLVAAARRPRDPRPDRGCEHARFIRSVVSSWRLAEVFVLCEQLEAGAALRDLATQAELAREPAAALHADLAAIHRDRWLCDVELVGAGWSLAAHRAILAARCSYFRDLLQRYPSACRVPLEGAGASLCREELELCVAALYAGPSACARRLLCDLCSKWERGPKLEPDLDIISGEGTARGAGGVSSGGAVCADERVLPRRFARALLHAAYTDQVDLSLVGRGSSSPASTASGGTTGTAWTGTRGSPRPATAAALDDAFQLYEIARFLEMPIVVQGCEDAIVEALSAETLPHVLRWASASHASQWVHRQAMRYLRDEFPSIMAHAASARLPRAALADALASPFLQASEAQALRALLRWAERAALAKTTPPHDQREPNVIWHTAHSVSRRGARRRDAGEAALREALAALLPLVRLEHLPPDCDLLHQAVRRGAVPQPPPQMVERGAGADAWLARGTCRPPRCFLPYLDEIKALLEDQAVPEAELARVRRARYLHRIPDTLYMVAAARSGSSAGSGAGGVTGSTGGGAAGSTGGGAEAACVSPRVLAALRARARELRASPPAARALELHASDTKQVHQQIALRAVREMSLPDSCAELLLQDCEDSEGAGAGEENWECREESWPRGADPRDLPGAPDVPDLPDLPDLDLDCCRSGSGSLRSTGAPLPPAAFHQPERESGTCRRELPPRPDAHSRSMRARLSACVPDVAMAPNANTHLLTARDYLYAAHHQHQQHQHQSHQQHQQQPHHPHAHQLQQLRPAEYGGGVLQLDLGDGATHTPRPGSRAQRAGGHAARQHRDAQGAACARPRTEDDELRAAIELSVIRAYSSLAGAGAARSRHYADLLPPEFAAIRSRATPSPSALSAGSVGNVGSLSGVGGAAGGSGSVVARRRLDRLTPPPRLSGTLHTSHSSPLIT
ncbi:BTB/POZ domain-containing protein 7 [Battus philenor]|uniref:BTB/POZ domain-containing protein 7 n=1 Tax=Battus philenor TaxID=42288 RepID=UPI0035D0EA53